MSIIIVAVFYATPFPYGVGFPGLFGALAIGSAPFWCCGACGLCARGSVQKNSRAHEPDTLPPRRLSARPTKLTATSGGPSDTIDTKPGPLESYAFQTLTRNLPKKESVLQSDKLSPVSMLDQAKQVVRGLGLRCAIDDRTAEEGHIRGRVVGYGTSETTGRSVAVDITVSSVVGTLGSLCIVDVYSDDNAERDLLDDRVHAGLTRRTLPIQPIEPVRRPQELMQSQLPVQGVAASGRLEMTDESVRFVVEVTNRSDQPIYAVRVRLVSYPSDVMKLSSTGETMRSRMGTGAGHKALFELVPTADWTMKGEVVAQVTYTDAKEKLHTIAVNPPSLEALQDLRVPEPIDAGEFEMNLSRMESGELSLNIENVTVADMHERARTALSSLKFYEVSASFRNVEGILMGELNWWTRGRYSKKGLALSVVTYGQKQSTECSCRIVVYAEDDRAILPTIEEIRAALRV